MARNKVVTGNLRGGHMGTRQHPDSAGEREDARATILASDQEIVTGEIEVEMGEATVERGRTVQAPVPGKKRLVGYDRITGAQILGPVLENFGPGSTVVLPVDEIGRLRGLGFLVDPRQTFKTQKDIAGAQASRTQEPRSSIQYRSPSNSGASIHRA